jgi:cytidyltransferase-like protein
MQGEIVQLGDVPDIRGAWEGKRSVLVGGCFDLLHYGHYAFLKAAKQEGDVLIVALEHDSFIERRKGRHPVHTQIQRAELLAAFRMVDYVIPLPLMQTDADYGSLMDAVRPSVIAVTAGDMYVTQKERHALAFGSEVRQVTPLVESFSSSSIIEYASVLSD